MNFKEHKTKSTLDEQILLFNRDIIAEIMISAVMLLFLYSCVIYSNSIIFCKLELSLTQYYLNELAFFLLISSYLYFKFIVSHTTLLIV